LFDVPGLIDDAAEYCMLLIVLLKGSEAPVLNS